MEEPTAIVAGRATGALTDHAPRTVEEGAETAIETTAVGGMIPATGELAVRVQPIRLPAATADLVLRGQMVWQARTMRCAFFYPVEAPFR